MHAINVMYVTWAGVICLMYTHEPKGAQHPRASADISGKSRVHMLHMLCNTSGPLKNRPNLLALALVFYIGTGNPCDYGF